jgi:serine protease Do
MPGNEAEAATLLDTHLDHAPGPQPPIGNQKVADPEGVKIFEQYKDCVVDVKVSVTLETGETIQFGGSGALIDKDGTILTAAHVVKKENDMIQRDPFSPSEKIVSYDYWVMFKNKNRMYHAELLGANPYNDSALLKAQDFDASEYSVAKLGSSEKLKIGERVYAIGSPFGISLTLTAGTVGQLHRYLGATYLEDFIQSDTSINPGNSGGPLINSQGEVIGINTRGGRAMGNIMFAVPMTMIDLAQLKKGSTELPWFGLEALIENFARTGTEQNAMIEDLAVLNKLTGMRNIEHLSLLAKLTYHDRWAVVTQVDERKSPAGEQSPAKRAGLRKGDLVTKINGHAIRNGMEIRQTVVATPLGKELEIEFIRIDKLGVPQTQTAKLKLEKKPAAAPQDHDGHRR